jgi:hypothetical protein
MPPGWLFQTRLATPTGKGSFACPLAVDFDWTSRPGEVNCTADFLLRLIYHPLPRPLSRAPVYIQLTPDSESIFNLEQSEVGPR